METVSVSGISSVDFMNLTASLTDSSTTTTTNPFHPASSSTLTPADQMDPNLPPSLAAAAAAAADGGASGLTPKLQQKSPTLPPAAARAPLPLTAAAIAATPSPTPPATVTTPTAATTNTTNGGPIFVRLPNAEDGTEQLVLCTQHTFTGLQDKRGIMYYIGCEGGNVWKNPVNSKKIAVSASSVLRGTLSLVADHTFTGQIFYTDNKPFSWVRFDFKDYSVNINHYSMAHRAGFDGCYMRSWQLQASNDNNTWTVIKEHREDESLNKRNLVASWPIEDCNQFYRYLRIVIAPNGNSQGTATLILSCFEVYGLLRHQPAAAAAAANSTAAAASTTTPAAGGVSTPTSASKTWQQNLPPTPPGSAGTAGSRVPIPNYGTGWQKVADGSRPLPIRAVSGGLGGTGGPSGPAGPGGIPPLPPANMTSGGVAAPVGGGSGLMGGPRNGPGGMGSSVSGLPMTSSDPPPPSHGPPAPLMGKVKQVTWQGGLIQILDSADHPDPISYHKSDVWVDDKKVKQLPREGDTVSFYIVTDDVTKKEKAEQVTVINVTRNHGGGGGGGSSSLSRSLGTSSSLSNSITSAMSTSTSSSSSSPPATPSPTLDRSNTPTSLSLSSSFKGELFTPTSGNKSQLNPTAPSFTPKRTSPPLNKEDSMKMRNSPPSGEGPIPSTPPPVRTSPTPSATSSASIGGGPHHGSTSTSSGRTSASPSNGTSLASFLYEHCTGKVVQVTVPTGMIKLDGTGPEVPPVPYHYSDVWDDGKCVKQFPRVGDAVSCYIGIDAKTKKEKAEMVKVIYLRNAGTSTPSMETKSSFSQSKALAERTTIQASTSVSSTSSGEPPGTTEDPTSAQTSPATGQQQQQSSVPRHSSLGSEPNTPNSKPQPPAYQPVPFATPVRSTSSGTSGSGAHGSGTSLFTPPSQQQQQQAQPPTPGSMPHSMMHSPPGVPPPPMFAPQMIGPPTHYPGMVPVMPLAGYPGVPMSPPQMMTGAFITPMPPIPNPMMTSPYGASMMGLQPPPPPTPPGVGFPPPPPPPPPAGSGPGANPMVPQMPGPPPGCYPPSLTPIPITVGIATAPFLPNGSVMAPPVPVPFGAPGAPPHVSSGVAPSSAPGSSQSNGLGALLESPGPSGGGTSAPSTSSGLGSLPITPIRQQTTSKYAHKAGLASPFMPPLEDLEDSESAGPDADVIDNIAAVIEADAMLHDCSMDSEERPSALSSLPLPKSVLACWNNFPATILDSSTSSAQDHMMPATSSTASNNNLPMNFAPSRSNHQTPQKSSLSMASPLLEPGVARTGSYPDATRSLFPDLVTVFENQ